MLRARQYYVDDSAFLASCVDVINKRYHFDDFIDEKRDLWELPMLRDYKEEDKKIIHSITFNNVEEVLKYIEETPVNTSFWELIMRYY